MKKVATIVGMSALTVSVLAQFVRPTRENPVTDPALSIRKYKTIPVGPLAIIERSCFDCHSNETRWQWYSAITPLNFLVAGDVNKARKRLNFSEWRKHKPSKMRGLLQMIDDAVSSKEMPPPRYLSMHPGAALSVAEIKAISQWASDEQDRLSDDAENAQKNK